jgi:hypothetical protein
VLQLKADQRGKKETVGSSHLRLVWKSGEMRNAGSRGSPERKHGPIRIR